MQTVTAYDQRGQRTYEFHEQRVGGDYKGIAKEFRYDAAGQIIATRSRFALGEKRWTIVPPPSSGDNLVSEEVNVGGWLNGAEDMQYDADGRALLQATYERGMNGRQNVHPGDGDQYNDITLLRLISRVDYTEADGINPAWNDFDLSNNASAYDQAGRLTKYRYSSTHAINGDLPYTHTFTMTYEGWGSWQEREVYGTSTNTAYRDTVNRISFDAWGRIVHQGQHTYKDGVHDQIRVYTYTGDGMVHSRRGGWWDGRFKQLADKPQNALYVYSGGKQIAELQSGGGTQIQIAPGTSPMMSALITSNSKLFGQLKDTNKFSLVNGVAGQGAYSAGGGMVAVLEGEDLQAVSQRVYGSSRYWYVLAEANGLTASAALTPGLQLRAPEVSVSVNDANTFKPYNPNEAIGPTSPSLPYIPDVKGGCDMVTMILIIVIAVVVTVFTAGAAATAMAAAAQGVSFATAAAAASATGASVLGGVMAAGTAALTGGAIAGVAAGTMVSFTAAGAMAAGFVGGFMGSAVSQGAASLAGVGSFSWRNAAAEGVKTALTAGLASAPFMQSLAQGGRAAQVARGAISGAAGVTASYIGNKVAGNAASFSWRGVAATAVSSALTAGVTGGDFNKYMPQGVGGGTVNRFIGGVLDLHTRRAFGFDDKVDYGAIFANAFGSALGNSIASGIGSWADRRAEARLAPIREHSAKISDEVSANLQKQFNDELGKISLADAGFSSDSVSAKDRMRQGRTASRDSAGQAIDLMDMVRAEHGDAFDSALRKMGGKPTVLLGQAISKIIHANSQGVGVEIKSLRSVFSAEETSALSAYISGSGIDTQDYAKIDPEAMVMLVPVGAKAKDVYREISSRLGKFANSARFMRAATQGVFSESSMTDRSYVIDLTPAQREIAVLIDTAVLLHRRVQSEERNYRKAIERHDPNDEGSSMRLHSAEGAYRDAISEAYGGLEDAGYVPLGRMYRQSSEFFIATLGLAAAGVAPFESAIVGGLAKGVGSIKKWRQSVAAEARLRAYKTGVYDGLTKAEIAALRQRREDLNFYRDSVADPYSATSARFGASSSVDNLDIFALNALNDRAIQPQVIRGLLGESYSQYINGSLNKMTLAVARVSRDGGDEYFVALSGGKSWRDKAPDVIEMGGVKYKVVSTDDLPSVVYGSKGRSNSQHAEKKLMSYFQNNFKDQNVQISISVQNTSISQVGMCVGCGITAPKFAADNPTFKIRIYEDSLRINP